jgi:hypothetical protein
MTDMPNPFEFAASDAAAEKAAAPLLSQAPSGAAADLSGSGEPVATSPDEAAALASSQARCAAVGIPEVGPCGFEFEPATDGGGPQESPAPGQELCGAGDLEGDLSCIGEIFVGARKIGYVPDDLDPDAYAPADHLLYDVLKAMVDPHARDLPRIPDEDAFMSEVEERPLFLRQAG